MTTTLIPNPPADKPTFGLPTQQLPQDEDLLIVFHGLLSFSYVRQQPALPKPPLPPSDLPHCEIGVFNQDEAHRLIIDIQGGSCAPDEKHFEYTNRQLQDLADEVFKIEVVGTAPDVNFYQVGPQFNRDTSDHDFRWMVDVESPDLYNVQVPNKKPFYRPRLIVKNGTFFTLEKTLSTFKFVNKNHPNPTDEPMIGSIAFATAAKIRLNAGQQIRFDFRGPDQRRHSCTFGPEDAATIFFTNLCYDEHGKICTASDFHRHFDTFDPPPLRDPYDLTLVDEREATHKFGGLDKVQPPMASKPNSEDSAPCHAMGYGQSPGGNG